MVRKDLLCAVVLACTALAPSSQSVFAAEQGAAPVPSSVPSSMPGPCDNKCLNGLVDRYLTALVAHNPGQLPLATNVRFTEMGQELKVGDGFWFTASERGHYTHYFPDATAGQVGFMTTMKENGNPTMIGGRLKIMGGKISEIETILYRSGSGPAWNNTGITEIDARGTVDPLFLSVIPPAERATRAELIRDANKYFSGLEGNDGKGDYNFADDCFRVENGMQTTSHPELQEGADFNVTGLSCMGQFKSGYLAVVSRIYQRRFPIVDVEHGVVFSVVSFDHRGLKQVTLSDGKILPMTGFSRPSSILLAESFKIEKGKIRRIEAVGTGIPYKMSVGWPNDATPPPRNAKEKAAAP